MPVPFFLDIFRFRKALNEISAKLETSQPIFIFGIFATRKTEDETKRGHEAPSSPSAYKSAAPGGEEATSCAHRPRSFAYKYPLDIKNRARLNTFYSTGPEPPPLSTPIRERSELLTDTLPGGGIIPGGFYVAVTASGLMREKSTLDYESI